MRTLEDLKCYFACISFFAANKIPHIGYYNSLVYNFKLGSYGTLYSINNDGEICVDEVILNSDISKRELCNNFHDFIITIDDLKFLPDSIMSIDAAFLNSVPCEKQEFLDFKIAAKNTCSFIDYLLKSKSNFVTKADFLNSNETKRYLHIFANIPNHMAIFLGRFIGISNIIHFNIDLTKIFIDKYHKINKVLGDYK